MTKNVQCIDHDGNVHLVAANEIKVRVSAYGVLIDYGEILMVKDTRGGRWELPGGGVHADESLEEAVRRESKEETGLDVRVGKFLTYAEDYFYSLKYQEGWHTYRFFFAITKTGGELLTAGNGDDVLAAAMMKKTELSGDIVSKPAIEPVLRTLGLL